MGILFFLCTCLVYAGEGGSSGPGNGGGGFYLEGRLWTYGELGITVESGKLYLPSEDMRTAAPLFNITDKLKGFISTWKIAGLLNSIFGPSAQYRMLKWADPEKIRWVEEVYKKEAGIQLPSGAVFKLYAFTHHDPSGVVTDIFPDYFQLDPFLQSLILIHEAFIRTFPHAPIQDILAIESAIDRLFREYEPIKMTRAAEDLLQLLFKVGFLSRGEVLASNLRWHSNESMGLRLADTPLERSKGVRLSAIATESFEFGAHAAPLDQQLLFSPNSISNGLTGLLSDTVLVDSPENPCPGDWAGESLIAADSQNELEVLKSDGTFLCRIEAVSRDEFAKWEKAHPNLEIRKKRLE